MKVLQLNTVYKSGSTGKIVYQLHKLIKERGWTSKVGYNYLHKRIDLISVEETPINTWLGTHIHSRLARITMMQGCFSNIKTMLFLKKVKKYNPDLTHLHNIQGSYINHPQLFRFIKKQKKLPVIWTLHDCRSFTGYCSYFDFDKCEKWLAQCEKCPQHRRDSANIFDFSKLMYKLKRKWFTGIKNMTIVTPSQWLADLVKQSYLKDYPVKVINNGIDLSVFKPTPSGFRHKYGVGDKFMVLGVAFGWGKRKGLDVFIDLAERLDSSRYQIVLVGTDDNVDVQLPFNIVSIHRTNNQVELAEIYTAADVFVIPTREDNFPTVNMEALACGTPVITFDTGGSSEMLDDTCGSVVPCGDNDALLAEIIRTCETNPFIAEDCINRAKQYDMHDKFQEYIELYEELRNENK